MTDGKPAAKVAENRNRGNTGMAGRTIRIGGASAFWGDSMTAAPQLLMQGGVYAQLWRLQ